MTASCFHGKGSGPLQRQSARDLANEKRSKPSTSNTAISISTVTPPLCNDTIQTHIPFTHKNLETRSGVVDSVNTRPLIGGVRR